MKIVEYIKEQQRLTGKTVVPTIQCKDGFTVSCQASEYHYCTPRESGAEWVCIELGFPNQTPTSEVCNYAENGEDFLDTVYGYVPVHLVDAMLEEHGGIIN